ncbi:DUF1990 family protein [Arthrobacter mangrovi]|uniref:DUF1990 domain-containing protein n=1 Tax=Arthrobacter mangrovi TaxID=2966350 RepID=A0ABQ5MVN0_9MICC|nr:DUF1990 domain-containing protein [Arthrobacter mangrovi]GLB68018.1 DUF1990 domain-containing protein [Arthrobacter mangrovi]
MNGRKSYSAARLTYPDQGLTRLDRAPSGYRVVRHREAVGSGEEAFARLADGILGWNLHRGAGLRVDPATSRAAEGVDVVSRFGVGPLRLAAPCRVVWAVEEPDRAGFGYGTLPGHPASGEESFLAVLGSNGQVYLELFAFSRPSNWFYRAGAPVTVAVQEFVTRRYLAAARKLAAGS